MTYPVLSDFGRATVKAYGVMYDDPNHLLFRMAKRSYFVIDKNGIVQFKKVLEDPAAPLMENQELLDILSSLK